MVNVPPIPPLLCSTPPPIDFGEDDDEDVLPPSIDGGEDDDFGDFLSEDDTKSNETLPSPRPPSVCDLPPVSIYDDLLPPGDKGMSNHVITSSSLPKDDQICHNSKNNTKSTNFTEAFNLNVRNFNNFTNNVLQDELGNIKESKATECTPNITKLETVNKPVDVLETESNQIITDSQTNCSKPKNAKESITEPLNIETKCNNNNERNICCMQNVVSIEDVVDDLSDDELYSPKTPKNFTESNNLNDYFKIEEINPNETKSDSKDVNTKTNDIFDNNESGSQENENDNDFKSLSSNSIIQNNFETPPPLGDYSNSIDDEEDDFGDFADFQETHFVNNTVVPVNDIKQLKDIELNDFTKYNTIEDYKNVSKKSEQLNRLKDSGKIDEEFREVTTNCSTEFKHEEMSKDISQEILNRKNKDHGDIVEINKCKQTTENLSHKGNNFDAFNPATERNDKDDFGNFNEYSNTDQDIKDKNLNATEKANIEVPIKVSSNISNDDEEFNDFEDFESHQENVKSDEMTSSLYEDSENDGNKDDSDDDDDFGDFNTAEPITSTASNITLTKTSHNTTKETSALPSNNLNERILKILQLMFIPTINPAEDTSDQPETNKIRDIPFTSIDTAKALEYQWLISDTRHSFIRSLGIDSRNILYGDNWNPSLPRFAANLSFNPLKPMKPAQSSSSTGYSSSMPESFPVNSSERTQTLEISGCTKKEALDLNWKYSSATEQTIEAFKENTITPAVVSLATTSMPYISNEPPSTEPISLTVLENGFDNEEKLSNTPPISEMESVTRFTAPLPAAKMDKMNMDLPPAQIVNNIDDYDLKEMEENLKNSLNLDEVVVTSTFTGSFKETHIYTPPKTNDFDELKHTNATMSTSSSSPTKATPIDFDYEKAAMGVIIDETVVKKEYRDVEYNPPVSMEPLSKSVTSKTDIFEASTINSNVKILSSTDIKMSLNDVSRGQDEQESSDDFSEFQSVSSEVVVSAPASVPKNTNPIDVPKTTTVSYGGMILSPAILIPQAISMENQKPKIEWGDSTAAINPEELARIEELFPEPKSLKSSNSSQKSTPTHQVASTPSISATVANKELEGNINNSNDDDDYWSDFVSVTVTNHASNNKVGGNNNILTKSRAGSPFKPRSPAVSQRVPPTTNNSNNDDEWSEFVSSAPTSQEPSAYRAPQFNSGAWQNANFYNNPLSMYHKGPLNIPTAATPATTHFAQKSLYNNNNNYNISQQPYQTTNNTPCVMLGSNKKTPINAYQQQVHVMQNFSTARVPTPERLSAAAATAKNNQFQSIGTAKVAPSIALIPDLGFVAPAIPTHTSFINSLPKPNINTKK